MALLSTKYDHTFPNPYRARLITVQIKNTFLFIQYDSLLKILASYPYLNNALDTLTAFNWSGSFQTSETTNYYLINLNLILLLMKMLTQKNILQIILNRNLDYVIEIRHIAHYWNESLKDKQKQEVLVYKWNYSASFPMVHSYKRTTF